MAETPMTPKEREEAGLHLVMLRRMSELITAAFSFVAALAWNDAIQSLFVRVFGQGQGIIAKFIYALLVTIIVVVVMYRLSRLSNALENRLQPKKNPS